MRKLSHLHDPMKLLFNATPESLLILNEEYPELFIKVHDLAQIWMKEDRSAIRIWGYRKIQAIWKEASKHIYKIEKEKKENRDSLKIVYPLLENPLNIWDGESVCLKTVLYTERPDMFLIDKTYEKIFNYHLMGMSFRKGLRITHDKTRRIVNEKDRNEIVYDKLMSWVDSYIKLPDWFIEYSNKCK